MAEPLAKNPKEHDPKADEKQENKGAGLAKVTEPGKDGAGASFLGKSESPDPMIGKQIPIEIPLGSMNQSDVEPGFAPNQGSPHPLDPAVLFNPNDPASPVTKPMNASNPANMPAMQSEKSGAELRAYQRVLNKEREEKGEAKQSKGAKEAEKKKKELAEKIDKILQEYDGIESTIPQSHEYWGLVAEMRPYNANVPRGII